jgi:hypothetical protein
MQAPACLSAGNQKKKSTAKNAAVPLPEDSQRKKAVSCTSGFKKASWSKPNEFLRYTKDSRRSMPPTQQLWPILRVSWPVTSPCF